jgi:CheY-like chemotaxis protein
MNLCVQCRCLWPAAMSGNARTQAARRCWARRLPCGSTYEATVLAITASPTVVKLPIVPPGVPRLRVLVVDDNDDVAESMCALLASMGCSTAMASRGVQALALAAEFAPHLALIDLEMPDMSGCDVARLLRAGSPPCGAWLVCLTGRGLPEDHRLCIDAGFDDFFTKPIRPDSLADLVGAATAGLGPRKVHA